MTDEDQVQDQNNNTQNIQSPATDYEDRVEPPTDNVPANTGVADQQDSMAPESGTVETPMDETEAEKPSVDLKEIEQELEKRIIADMGFENATEEQRAKMIDSLNERISIGIMKVILENISAEEGQPLVDKMTAEEPADAQIEEIIKKHPELGDKIEEAMANMYETVVSEAQEIWSAASKKPEDNADSGTDDQPVDQAA